MPAEYQSGTGNDAKQKKADVEETKVVKESSKEARRGVKNDEKEEAVTPRQKTSKSPSKTQKLVSRSGIPEPRSKVLRLD